MTSANMRNRMSERFSRSFHPVIDLTSQPWWHPTIRTLATLTFVAALFPFFQPVDVGTNSDTQIWSGLFAAVVVALIVLGTKIRRPPSPLLALFAITAISTIDLVLRGDSTFGIRSVFGYLSVPLFAYTAFKTYRYVWPMTLPAAVSVWLVVGFIQATWNRDFGASFLPRLIAGEVRGITGLAPEPSALAFTAVLILVLNEFAFAEKRYSRPIYYAVLFALLLLMLASSSGLGILLVGLFVAVRGVAALLVQPNRIYAVADAIIVGVVALGLYSGLQRPNPFARTEPVAVAPTATPVPPSPTATLVPVSPSPTMTSVPVTPPPTPTTLPVSPTPDATVAPVLPTATNLPVSPTPGATLDPASPTATPVPAVPSPTATLVPVAPTATPIPVAPSPTSTSVPVSPSPTATAVPVSPTPTATAVPIPTPTSTVPKTLGGIRGRNLLARFLDDPQAAFERDGSVGERTSHVVLSGISLYESRGLGYGPGTWNDNAPELLAGSPDWVKRMTVIKFDLGGRILSGWGSVIYELGLIGVLFILTVFLIFGKSILASKKLARVTLTSALLVSAVMLGAVPLAFPIFGYIVGIHLRIAYADQEIAHSPSGQAGEEL